MQSQMIGVEKIDPLRLVKALMEIDGKSVARLKHVPSVSDYQKEMIKTARLQCSFTIEMPRQRMKFISIDRVKSD